MSGNLHCEVIESLAGGYSLEESPCLKQERTVRSLICTDKDQTKVEYVNGGPRHLLFVSRCLVAKPKPEQLVQLIETDRAAWEQHHPNPSPTEERL